MRLVRIFVTHERKIENIKVNCIFNNSTIPSQLNCIITRMIYRMNKQLKLIYLSMVVLYYNCMSIQFNEINSATIKQILGSFSSSNYTPSSVVLQYPIASLINGS